MDEFTSNSHEGDNTPKLGSAAISNKFHQQFFAEKPTNADNDFEKFVIELNNEIKEYKAILYENDAYRLKSTKCTKSFWRKYAKKLPLLYQLAEILLNINSSGAAIERFYSICGILSNKRASNLSPELFITRCLLRANIHILNELSNFNE